MSPTARNANLLGLTSGGGLKRGEPVPEDFAVMERADNLLAVYRGLQQLYAQADWLGDRWVSTPQSKLGGRTPLEIMLAQGLKGIKEIRRRVESEITAHGNN